MQSNLCRQCSMVLLTGPHSSLTPRFCWQYHVLALQGLRVTMWTKQVSEAPNPIPLQMTHMPPRRPTLTAATSSSPTADQLLRSRRPTRSPGPHAERFDLGAPDLRRRHGLRRPAECTSEGCSPSPSNGGLCRLIGRHWVGVQPLVCGSQRGAEV